MVTEFMRKNNRPVGEHITSNVIWSALVLGMSVFSYGFETSVLSTTQAMTPYEIKFGEWLEDQDRWGFTSAKLSYLNSLPLITYAFGVVAGSQVGERWGRKPVLIGMNLVCIVGCLICITSKSYTQMLAGRMVIYIHVGIEAWLVPMFQAEIVPAAVRGRFVSLYAFDHIFAGLICAIITNFTSKINDDRCWLIPFGLMFIWPVTTLALCWMVPESPRWLVRKGRLEDATKNLEYLYGVKPGYSAENEAKYLLETVEENTTKGSWSDLIKGTNLKRTVHGTIASFLTQATGQAFASNYGTIFMKSIGVFDPFTGTMIKRLLLVCGTLVVIFFVDKTGRRPMFFVAGSITVAALMTMGGLGLVSNPPRRIGEGIIAMSMLFPAAYFPSFGANLLVVKAEIPHVALRDKSTMIFWMTANIANFVVTFTLPYLLTEPAWLGSKVGFIFGTIGSLGLIWAFFFMPELSGKSLEDIDTMFEQNIPAWRTRNWKAPENRGHADRKDAEVDIDASSEPEIPSEKRTQAERVTAV